MDIRVVLERCLFLEISSLLGKASESWYLSFVRLRTHLMGKVPVSRRPEQGSGGDDETTCVDR